MQLISSVHTHRQIKHIYTHIYIYIHIVCIVSSRAEVAHQSRIAIVVFYYRSLISVCALYVAFPFRLLVAFIFFSSSFIHSFARSFASVYESFNCVYFGFFIIVCVLYMYAYYALILKQQLKCCICVYSFTHLYIHRHH